MPKTKAQQLEISTLELMLDEACEINRLADHLNTKVHNFKNQIPNGYPEIHGQIKVANYICHQASIAIQNCINQLEKEGE